MAISDKFLLSEISISADDWRNNKEIKKNFKIIVYTLSVGKVLSKVLRAEVNLKHFTGPSEEWKMFNNFFVSTGEIEVIFNHDWKKLLGFEGLWNIKQL